MASARRKFFMNLQDKIKNVFLPLTMILIFSKTQIFLVKLTKYFHLPSPAFMKYYPHSPAFRWKVFHPPSPAKLGQKITSPAFSKYSSRFLPRNHKNSNQKASEKNMMFRNFFTRNLPHLMKYHPHSPAVRRKTFSPAITRIKKWCLPHLDLGPLTSM